MLLTLQVFYADGRRIETLLRHLGKNMQRDLHANGRSGGRESRAACVPPTSKDQTVCLELGAGQWRQFVLGPGVTKIDAMI